MGHIVLPFTISIKNLLFLGENLITVESRRQLSLNAYPALPRTRMHRFLTFYNSMANTPEKEAFSPAKGSKEATIEQQA